MSLEDNKALLRRVIENVINQHNLAAIDDLFASDYVDHDLVPGQDIDLPGFKHFAATLFTAFPDFHVVIEDILAEGDRVMYRGTVSGTHTGDFMGVHPTGGRFSVLEMHVDRIAGGKMAEHWGLVDVMSMLQQLGIVHEPEEG